MTDIATDHPAELESWLHDPYAVPHGGESLAELITRVGRALDDHPWPNGRSVVVVTSLVARALIVHALGAGPEVIFRIDVSPLGRAQVSRGDSRSGACEPQAQLPAQVILASTAALPKITSATMAAAPMMPARSPSALGAMVSRAVASGWLRAAAASRVRRAGTARVRARCRRRSPHVRFSRLTAVDNTSPAHDRLR